MDLYTQQDDFCNDAELLLILYCQSYDLPSVIVEGFCLLPGLIRPFP